MAPLAIPRSSTSCHSRSVDRAWKSDVRGNEGDFSRKELMTTTDINKIAAEARTLLEGISKVNAKHDTLVADRNARVKPLLERVHHTLTVLKQPVEGVTSWNAWAQKAGWSKRN